MILTPKIYIRLVAIVVLGVILQLSFFSQVTVFHVSPDLLPSLVVALGLLGGSMTGAVSGFSVGFLLNCLLVQPLGGGSLVLLSVGYLAGLFRERAGVRGPLVPPLLCIVLTVLAELGFGAVELTLATDVTVSGLVIRDILLQGVFAFVGGWLIYLGLRRALRPALVDEHPVRASRPPTVLGA
jgi:rod shape-determining protein MreD